MCRKQVTLFKPSPGDSVDGDIDDQRIQRAQFTGYNFPPFHAWRDRNLLYDRDRRARCGDFHSIKWYKDNREFYRVIQNQNYLSGDRVSTFKRPGVKLNMQQSKVRVIKSTNFQYKDVFY